ncbi:uncharacterized protein [Physcomitrium patens]|uniref:uncharacterized protein n=1 Tax=Physcomitrium patens TaxID=3218 RepID=UPI003CCE03E2
MDLARGFVGLYWCQCLVRTVPDSTLLTLHEICRRLHGRRLSLEDEDKWMRKERHRRQRQAVPGESCAPKAHHAAGPGWAMPTLPVALGSFGAKRGGQGSVRSLANFQLHRHGQPLPILLNAILFLAPPSQALSALPTTPPPFDRCLPPSRVYILFSSGNITRIFSGSSASVSSTCEFEDIFSVLRPSEIASCRSSLCLSMPWLVFCSPFEASPWFLIIPWLIDGSWMVHGCLVVEALGSS